MISEVTLSPEQVAIRPETGSPPPLPRAAQGDGAARRHRAPGHAALARQAEPGSLARRARGRGGNLAAGSLRPRRPPRERGPARAGAVDRRPATRRPQADRRGHSADASHPRAADDVARRSPARSGACRARRPSKPRFPRCNTSFERTHDLTRDRTSHAHLPQPPPPSQLPHLLLRPARLPGRLVDAEHRARVARARALGLAARDRRARVLPLRAVHRLRPRRRSRRRPHGHAQARHGDARRGADRVDRRSPWSR